MKIIYGVFQNKGAEIKTESFHHTTYRVFGNSDRIFVYVKKHHKFTNVATPTLTLSPLPPKCCFWNYKYIFKKSVRILYIAIFLTRLFLSFCVKKASLP